MKRAVIVSNPAVVLECMPGCVALHDIEIKNNTHWGWKKGVFLGIDTETLEAHTDLPIESINIPVE